MEHAGRGDSATTTVDYAGLVLPREAGARALRGVVNGVARRQLAEYLALRAEGLGEARARLHQTARAVVESALRSDPRAVSQALRRPTHDALLAMAFRRRSTARGAPVASLSELDLITLLELAARSALADEAPVVVARPAPSWPVLRSLTARLEIAPAPSVGSLEFRNGALLAHGPAGADAIDLSPHRRDVPSSTAHVAVREGYRTITDGLVLALTDNNPDVHIALHPERSGNAIDLGGRDPDAWTESVRAALSLLDAFLPALRDETRVLLQAIAPVGYHEERHFSCSYPDALGAIYLSLHPNPMTMVEAVIHEFQHNKLHAALRLDPLLRDEGRAVYASPVRPDLRPLHGVLLAVHAFLPVAELYKRMEDGDHPHARSRDWERRFREVVRVNREGAQTLFAHARPTAAGSALLGAIRDAINEWSAYEKARGWCEG